MAANPELKWADTSQRGYMMLEITPKRVTGEWLFMQTIATRRHGAVGHAPDECRPGAKSFLRLGGSRRASSDQQQSVTQV